MTRANAQVFLRAPGPDQLARPSARREAILKNVLTPAAAEEPGGNKPRKRPSDRSLICRNAMRSAHARISIAEALAVRPDLGTGASSDR